MHYAYAGYNSKHIGMAVTEAVVETDTDNKVTAKLAADGWDSLSITEPSGDPDTWTVPQKLMWLVMRFLNSHSSDNFNGIQVKKSDDTISTTQRRSSKYPN